MTRATLLWALLSIVTCGGAIPLAAQPLKTDPAIGLEALRANPRVGGGWEGTARTWNASSEPEGAATWLFAQLLRPSAHPNPEPGISNEPNSPAEPAGAEGEIVPLSQSERAPWAGLLIEEADLVRWKLTIDHLQFRLVSDVRLEIEKSSIRVGAVQEKMMLAHESHLLKEKMYQDRLAEKDRFILAAEMKAEKAAHRGFFEQPLVWFVMGAAIPIAAALTL